MIYICYLIKTQKIKFNFLRDGALEEKYIALTVCFTHRIPMNTLLEAPSLKNLKKPNEVFFCVFVHERFFIEQKND